MTATDPLGYRRAYPSAGARTTTWKPRTPLAPGLLSTTMDVFRAAPSRVAISRAIRSVPEPAAAGSTIVIGRLGQLSGCANTEPIGATPAKRAAVLLIAVRLSMFNDSVKGTKTVWANFFIREWGRGLQPLH